MIDARDTMDAPDLMPYLEGVRFEKAAIEKALANAPCPDGYHYVVLENCDVMLAPNISTPS